MRCILACDLKNGIVVKGVRGERDKYRPIAESSLIVKTSVPREVISEIRPRETYIADLDRITGVGNHLSVIKSLSDITMTMADTGVSCIPDFMGAGRVANTVVVGTETAPLSVIEQCQGKHMVVSMDMKNGSMMYRDPAFNVSPSAVLKLLNQFELGGIILLDVGRVGSGEGIDLPLVASAVSISRHNIIVGGGVRDVTDLELLDKSGVCGAIVASAVHDGRIPLKMLRA
jgi:phosphoribosylformimino-5-aminoimidazole carboxamide ribotide isomerase